MENSNKIRLFNDRKIRTHWDEEQEKWYFSVIDVIEILTDQPTFQGARNYWKVLKSRLLKEGNETVTNCNRLKLVAEDGKLRATDVADTEQLFRLIQSIPSPKAEPFKMWLAKVGYDPQFGARPVKRLLQKNILNDLSKKILSGEVASDKPVWVDVREEELYFRNA